MVAFLLILSAILLLNAIAMYRAHWFAILVVFGGLAFIGFGILSFSTRSLMLVFPFLIATWVACRWRKVSRKRFAGFATLSIAAGWVTAMLLFIPQWKEIQQLAEDYPIVRMDERLAYEHVTVMSSTAAPGDATNLRDKLESKVSLEPWARNHRRSSLASLEKTHDDFVAAFVSQEGFGFGRMFHMPASTAHIDLQEPEPLSLPRLTVASPSASVVEETKPAKNMESFSDFHLNRTIDFVNPQGFGWALDGGWDYYGRTASTRVRGFQSHAFSELPSGSPAGDEWQLARLELVSLLKHDPPAVYLSEHLPRMQELASNDAPTRALNAFEARSLQQLYNGDTIIAEEGRNRIMMLGGLRAARQCLQCHSVKEGHLLGAFSYEFVRKQPLPPDEKPKPPEPVT